MDEPEVAPAPTATDEPEPETPPADPRGWPGRLVALGFVAAGLGWIAALAFGIAAAAPAGGIGLLRALSWIGLGSGPLALLAILYLLLMRTGTIEANRYARASRRLAADSRDLAALLALVNRRIGQARADLGEQGDALVNLGDRASKRLAESGAALRDEAAAFAQTAARIDDATATARTDLGVVIADLPRAENLARQLIAQLREAGGTADGNARTLATLLATLDERARAAERSSGGAAETLAGRLERIEAGAAAADRRMDEAASAMGRAIDAAMTDAAEAIEQARAGVAGQSAALTAMVEQGRAALQQAGGDAAQALGRRLDDTTDRIEAVAARLRAHEAAAQTMLGQLDQAIGTVEARFAALEESGAGHTADLAGTIGALADHADMVGRALRNSDIMAETLLGRIASLREQTQSSATTICDTIPAALARIRLHAELSLQAIAVAGPRGEALSETAATIAARLAEADALLERQQATIDALGESAEARLAGLREQTDALHTLLGQADADVRALAEGASGNLVDALLRVRDTATQAADHARDALASAIPRAAAAMGQAGATALRDALRTSGREEIAAVGAASAQAIDSARAASERLSRQLMTIAETSAAIEARIASHNAATEAHDEQSFARQVGLLIEALNSTAIDVAKIFSNDVTDAAWAAYLKGDRGIFTRRAVRLLDRGEARAIAGRYGDDPEFHDQVNRYIHDFEAMLRRVMATREGAPLGVTIVSSDMGKLYVALAQAIERLR